MGGLLSLVKAENLCPDGTDLSFVPVTPDGHCLIDPDFAEFKGPCSENKNQCALCIRNETEVEKICKISCQNSIAKCQEVMDDRQGGHWPKYGSSTLKLKRKIRKLEYQLEQKKKKKKKYLR